MCVQLYQPPGIEPEEELQLHNQNKIDNLISLIHERNKNLNKLYIENIFITYQDYFYNLIIIIKLNIMSRRIITDEIEFETPYGKLVAKSWHEEEEKSKRVLFLHGWMDNAGSFDQLAPLLKHPDGLYLVALDLPGHGKSSQLPSGVCYSDMTLIMEIRRCVQDLGWASTSRSQQRNNDDTNCSNNVNLTNNKKFTIMGHSLGSGLGLFYASLFPDDVEQLIFFDFIKTKTVSLKENLRILAENIDQFIAYTPPSSSNRNSKETDKGQVIVSHEAALVATIEAHKQVGTLSREHATCLLKRSTVDISTPPNSVIYSRDLRLQFMLNFRDTWEQNLVYFEGVECNVLSLLGKNGLYVVDPHFKDHFEDAVQFLKKKCKNVHVQWLEGDHYLHMNNARAAADIINEYFLVSPEGYVVV